MADILGFIQGVPLYYNMTDEGRVKVWAGEEDQEH